MDLRRTNSIAGFGFSHDGSVDSLPRFIQDASLLQRSTDSRSGRISSVFDRSDLTAGALNDPNRSPGCPPRYSGRGWPANYREHFRQCSLLDSMVALANSNTSRVDLIVKGFENGLPRGWFYDRTTGNFQSDRQRKLNRQQRCAHWPQPAPSRPIPSFRAEPDSEWALIADGDSYLDRDELDFGSDPTNPFPSLRTRRRC